MKLLSKLMMPATLIMLLGGCMKDKLKHTYTVYVPVYQTLSHQRALIGNTAPTALQQTGKIYVKDNWIFINEKDKGIHVIDNSNPAQPKNIAFWNIPGNRDLAIAGNILYADVYCDIAAIDISDPTHIVVDKFLTNIDPSRLTTYTTSTNPDSIEIAINWITKDTTVSSEVYNSWLTCPCYGLSTSVFAAVPAANTSTATTATGTGSSTERFTILNNHLFALSTYQLYSIDISAAANPSLSGSTAVGGNSQTIYPFQNDLFIGTTTGMEVYDVSNPSSPQAVSWASHWCMGDPVITDGKYAYVTLSRESSCHSTFDQLEIFDVTDISSPQLVTTYPITSPHGLSKDGNLLFICDAADGLRIFDATDVNNLKLLAHVSGINAQDVITSNSRALVITQDALLQYDYSDVSNIKFISKISSGN